MNIVILNDYGYIQGGSDQLAYRQAIGLSKLGHNVIWFCAQADRGGDSKHGNLPGIANMVTTKQVDINHPGHRIRAAIQGLWNFKAAKLFQKTLDTLDADNTVILVHGYSKALSASCFPVAHKKNMALVLIVHDYFSWCPNGSWHNYQSHQACHLRPMSPACVGTHCDRRSYPQKIWRLVRQLAFRIAGVPQRFSLAIFNTHFSQQLAKKLGPQARDSTVITPYAPTPASLSVRTTRTGFAYIGRLEEEKGALLFAQACAAAGVTGTFIGDGPLRDSIQKIHPDARITGWVNSKEIPDLLANALALVVPTTLRETYGLTVDEGAALGVASIVASNTAPASLIEDQVTGLIFEQGSVESLTRQLKYLQSNPNQAKYFGEEARARLQKNQENADYIQLLQQALTQTLERSKTL